MGLDGDIIAVVPAKEGNGGLTREEIMTMHDKNVQMGINNWNNFVGGISKIVHLAADLARRPMPNSSNDVAKVIPIPSPVSSNSQRQVGTAAADAAK
jgi:hypothetical protein